MYYSDGRAVPPRDLYADVREEESRTRFGNSTAEAVIIGILLIPIFISAAVGRVRDQLGLDDPDSR